MIDLSIDSEIYSDSTIAKAIADYKNLAKISISHIGGKIRLNFTDCKFNGLITIKEFENYLIGLENM